VQPNHVTVGHGNIMGNPEGPPVPAAALPYTPGSAGKGHTIGICDTGIWKNAATKHPGWLGSSFAYELGDIDDLLTGAATTLAPQAGHGTFVAGVVRQAAPGVSFDPEVALSPAGYGDEVTLAKALQGLGQVDIINLSLGYSSQGDVEPLLALAFPAGPPSPVIVASAGNSGDFRPVWPAGFKDVLSVAAVIPDSAGEFGVSRALYSSYGPWVEACAFGERVSTYVTGYMGVGNERLNFDGWARWKGTSFAAPHVAGTLAKLMTDLNCDAQQARVHLLTSGRPGTRDCGVLVV
jgi:subtilisin family serine protease